MHKRVYLFMYIPKFPGRWLTFKFNSIIGRGQIRKTYADCEAAGRQENFCEGAVFWPRCGDIN